MQDMEDYEIVEEELWETMLREIARRGNTGASRDDLFRALHGISYEDLEYLLGELERLGFLTVQWLGTYDFVATVTPEGLDQLT